MSELRKGGLIFFLLGLLLYANTLEHDFVLDDKMVITDNQFTKKGLNGLGDIFTSDSMTGFFGRDKNLVSGGRYRPLTLATHAIEYEFFGESALVGHLFNALYYGLLLWILFSCFSRVLGQSEKKFYEQPAFWLILLFAVHPVHVEVVANIKGRDDLLSLLLASVGWLIYERNKSNITGSLLFGLFFFLSLLAKESSVVFFVLIPMLYYYVDREFSVEKAAKLMSPLLGAGIIYGLIRYSVIGLKTSGQARELMNNPFLNATTSEFWGSNMYVLAKYLQLLVFPHPLTHDYYPKHVPLTGFTEPASLVSVLLLLVLLGLGIWGLLKRKKWTLGIWFFFGGIGLYANILFPIGTFMNERFLLIPSLGFAIFVVLGLHELIKKKQIVQLICLAIAIPMSVKTIARNEVWESDATLALTDVEVSENSAKANLSAASALLDQIAKTTDAQKKKALIQRAHRHLAKALELHPTYFPPVDLLGMVYFEAENYPKSAEMYAECLKRTSDPKFKRNLLVVANKSVNANQPQGAIQAAEAVLRVDSNNVEALNVLGEVYGKQLNDLENAAYYLEKAYALAPENSNVIQKIGIVYAMRGNPQKALEVFEKGVSLHPDNAKIWLNYGITLRGLGRQEEAMKAFSKAQQLDPSLVPNGS